MRPRSRFAHLLSQHLAKRKFTFRGFAEEVGVSAGFVSDLVHERRGPPDDVEIWGKRLGLEGEGMAEFMLAAGLARSPKTVVDHVQLQADRIAKLEGLLARKSKEMTTSKPRAVSKKV